MAKNKLTFAESLRADPGFRAGNILDLRAEQRFAAGHLPGSVNLPVPPQADLATVLPSIFLPPRHQPLLVLADRIEWAAACAAELAGRGRGRVTALAYPDSWPQDNAALEVATGPGRHHLGRPDPWLRRHAGLLPPPAAGRVLDLGCGSGRSAVWLALRGYRVLALDWQEDALRLGRLLAEHCGVQCDFRPADLRDPQVVPTGPYAGIINFRFLQRDLVACFDRWLQPAGVAMIRTFRHAPGYRGHPALRHRLQPNELLRLLQGAHLTVLAHEEGHDPDGRPAAGVVVRRGDHP